MRCLLLGGSAGVVGCVGAGVLEGGRAWWWGRIACLGGHMSCAAAALSDVNQDITRSASAVARLSAVMCSKPWCVVFCRSVGLPQHA
jgi:hypothetical protein